ncbi:hypothetical protein NEMBOFW57_004418 [Staphylotrichum longicolle]|uniref:DUF7514 domain-containing protein n=1 Tax=Staphylotrichum longicolle TaxID=669026 RepID=A0AAD4I3M1_9PEZI|nr:hypothetical protein NEMBOFW57_004418 [Staphylotrichum longicolle]
MKWGVLFDQNGLPTKRWEQVIRGLGNYLMDEFMPQKTLVITPGKLAAFYSHHKLDLEVFSFTDIFRNRQDVSPTKLAELYQQLACEYYLVPADSKARPTVPGLTLTGWARWMTLAMRAYPNEEAQRLAKAVSALPINADSPLDGKPERLPKQLSRRLLPEKADRQARMLFDAALKGHLEATRPASPTTNPTPTPTSQSAPSSRPQSPRSRYRPAGLPSPPASQAGDDRDDHHPHPNSRRRSSYREHSGSARTYEPTHNTPPPRQHARDAGGPRRTAVQPRLLPRLRRPGGRARCRRRTTAHRVWWGR